jgi:hypothetical protein
MRAKIHTLVFLGFTAVAGLLSGCVVDNRHNPPPGGSCLDQRYATVGWDIVKDVNNAPLTCEQANAQYVDLYFGPYYYRYNCNAYQGTTDSNLPPGNYTTSMQLLSPGGQVLSDTAANGPASFPIYDCQPDDIQNVTFGVL